jgi:hypothetical protein
MPWEVPWFFRFHLGGVLICGWLMTSIGDHLGTNAAYDVQGQTASRIVSIVVLFLLFCRRGGNFNYLITRVSKICTSIIDLH